MIQYLCNEKMLNHFVRSLFFKNEGKVTKEENLDKNIEELTLLLMYLTSWNETGCIYDEKS